MAEKRSFFQMIFGTKEQKTFGTQLELLNGYSPTWTSFDGRNLYSNNDIRACIDAIARNVAKLSPKHIREYEKDEKWVIENVKGRVQRLVSKRPNEIDNAYSFYYKVASELYLNNNCFIYISRDEFNRPKGLYVIKAGTYTLVEYAKHIFLRFSFNSGQTYTASLEDDIIHLKRFYCGDEVLGGNSLPIIELMSFKHILKEGIINAIKTTQSIKGILKTTKAMLKPEDIKAMRNQFVTDFLNAQDGTGIASTDATTEFQPVNINPQTATDGQLQTIDNDILNYFGINEHIIRSDYTEDQWNAFYESVIEPMAVQMSLEFTEKLFTPTEKYFGNEIFFEANKLQYASNTTKVRIARYMNNYMTINEIREVFNLAPVENGDRFLQSLNFIDSELANDYQGGNEDE